LLLGVLSCSDLKNDVAGKIQSAEEMAFSDLDSGVILFDKNSTFVIHSENGAYH